MITAPAPRTQSSATWNPLAANAVDVDVRYREHTIDVSLNGTVVRLDLPELVPLRARNASLDQTAHLDPLVSSRGTGRSDR